VTGAPFPTLMEQQVLGPLGMTHSTFEQPLSEARAAAAARGHQKGVVVPGGWHVYPELAAAGLWTTPTDLAIWAIAAADAMSGRSTTFLSPATASQMIAPAVGKGPRPGLGLFFLGSGDTLNFSHSGQNEGFVNAFKMYAKTGQGAAIMSNTRSESGSALIGEIQCAIAAEFAWPESGTTKITAVAVDSADLDRFVGTYVFDLKARRLSPRVVREGAKLFVEGLALARQELYPQSPTTFIGTGGTHFAFSRDAAGRTVLIMGEGTGAATGLKQ
jgi:CubicO group peptidase (beta-lactamase class C family)